MIGNQKGRFGFRERRTWAGWMDGRTDGRDGMVRGGIGLSRRKGGRDGW